eukprot:4005058-Karenia_brevis.AAC.1
MVGALWLLVRTGLAHFFAVLSFDLCEGPRQCVASSPPASLPNFCGSVASGARFCMIGQMLHTMAYALLWLPLDGKR